MLIGNKREVRRDSEREAVRNTMRERKKADKQNIRFLSVKVWVSYLLGLMAKDRGKIPGNINNKIMITNNLYITKSYMSSIIQVVTLSLDTPVVFMQDLTEYVRGNGSKAIIDYTIKNLQYDVKLKDTGLQSRINMWGRAMSNPLLTEREKEVAASCMYTVDVVKNGNRIYKSRIFITVRAKCATDLVEAEKLVHKRISAMKGSYLNINGNVEEVLSYMAIMSDTRTVGTKDLKAIITSNQVLSQLMPNTNSISETDYMYWGVNILNGTPFRVRLDDVTMSRNIYAISPSGGGKTKMALNIACSAAENHYAICIQDIKGNESAPIINALGGHIVSLRKDSVEYINSFAMRKGETTDENADAYFKSNFEFSKKQMLLLSGAQDPELLVDIEDMLDLFLDNLYTGLGVLSTNRNTWTPTERLNPFVVYEYLQNWVNGVREKRFDVVVRKVMTVWKMTMSSSGSKSRIFLHEFRHSDIMEANALSFDFGMLNNSYSEDDLFIFKLKFEYMSRLNANFVTYKYTKGVRVLKILEESQIVVDYPEIMRSYVEEFTMRRSQNQDTLLLGNAISALTSTTLSKPLIENVNGLLIGQLSHDAMDEVIKRFSLQEQADLLWSLGKDDKYRNAFVFVDCMHTKALTPIIKIILDKDKEYKLFTPVMEGDGA